MVDTILVSEHPQCLEKSFLHQKYVVENVPAKKIALDSGLSLTTIKLYLRRFGLTKSGCGKGIHREKLAFGTKLVGYSLEPHKGEGQILESIKRMYQVEGLGPTAIARILDSMKVPTKRQGKKWDHSVVADILEREGGDLSPKNRSI